MVLSQQTQTKTEIIFLVGITFKLFIILEDRMEKLTGYILLHKFEVYILRYAFVVNVSRVKLVLHTFKSVDLYYYSKITKIEIRLFLMGSIIEKQNCKNVLEFLDISEYFWVR